MPEVERNDVSTRRIEIRVAGDQVVSAIAMQPEPVDSVFVFAHGAGAGMDHRFMAAVAEGLAARRIATLRYQFPYMQGGKRRVDAPALAHATVRAAAEQARASWPALPLFAGGKSFGGRMTSQAQAIEPLAGVVGLMFLGFPLHPAGKPSVERAAHLASVSVPMLFVHGTRDALAEPAEFDSMTDELDAWATRIDLAGADHSFHVPKRSGVTDDELLESVLDAMAVWTQAWQI